MSETPQPPQAEDESWKPDWYDTRLAKYRTADGTTYDDAVKAEMRGAMGYQVPRSEVDALQMGWVKDRATRADIRTAVEQGRTESREKWGKRYTDAKEGFFGRMKGLRDRVASGTEKGKNALATIEAVATNPDVRRTTMEYVDDNVIQPAVERAQTKLNELQVATRSIYDAAVAKGKAGMVKAENGLKWTVDKGKTAGKYGLIGGGLVVASPVIVGALAGYGAYKTGEYGFRQGQRGARWTGEQARAGGAWVGSQVDRGVSAGREAYRATSEAVRRGVSRAQESLDRQQKLLNADARLIGNRVDAAWNDAMAATPTAIAAGRGRAVDTLDRAAARFHGWLRGGGISETRAESIANRKTRAAESRTTAETWRAERDSLLAKGRT